MSRYGQVVIATVALSLMCLIARTADAPVGIITTVAGNGETGIVLAPEQHRYLGFSGTPEIKEPGPSGEGGPATEANLAGPFSVALSADGNLYIADTFHHRISKVDPKGIITVVAGNGKPGYSGDGGPATKASLNTPIAVAVGPEGSVYIADTNNDRVRKVDPGGTITTVVGDGWKGEKGKGRFAGDGDVATKASLRYVTGVAVGVDGSLYIADGGNNRIRKVDSKGIIRTVAGGGSDVDADAADGGPATKAVLEHPSNLAIAADGTVFIAENEGSYRIHKVDPQGIITTVAGNGKAGYSGDGGPATLASLNWPKGLAIAADGALYIADFGNNRIRRVDPKGTITTVAGNGKGGFSGDGGSATEARLLSPMGVAIGQDGSSYIADTGNSRIRKVTWIQAGKRE